MNIDGKKYALWFMKPFFMVTFLSCKVVGSGSIRPDASVMHSP